MKSWTTKGGHRITRVLGGRSNVFLVEAGGYSLLFDSSVGKYRKKIRQGLHEAGIDTIDYLILSHVHFDHMGNASFIKRQYGAWVIVQENEADFLRHANSPVPAGTNFFTRFLVRRMAPGMTSWFTCMPCEPDITVSDRYDFSAENMNAYLLHTPGHSIGMMSLIVDDEIALVGDALFGIFPGSIFPPFADDVPELIRSWGKLLLTGCRLYLPAHGRAIPKKMLERHFKIRRNRV